MTASYHSDQNVRVMAVPDESVEGFYVKLVKVGLKPARNMTFYGITSRSI